MSRVLLILGLTLGAVLAPFTVEVNAPGQRAWRPVLVTGAPWSFDADDH
jgi:hypothetical protein